MGVGVHEGELQDFAAVQKPRGWFGSVSVSVSGSVVRVRVSG